MSDILEVFLIEFKTTMQKYCLLGSLDLDSFEEL